MPDVLTRGPVRVVVLPDPVRRAGVVLGALLAVLLVVGGAFVVVPPAAAHDALLSSEPADGATVDELPREIVLTFSGEPMTSGAEVVLTGADGEFGLKDLSADGTVLTATVPSNLSAGEYEVAWHIVSGDGHPLEGAFSFTVKEQAGDDDAASGAGQSGDGTGSEGGTDAEAGAGPEPAEDPATAEVPEINAAPSGDGAGEETAAGPGAAVPGLDGVPTPVVLAGAAVATVAVVLAIVVGMRRKLNADEDLRRRGYRGGTSDSSHTTGYVGADTAAGTGAATTTGTKGDKRDPSSDPDTRSGPEGSREPGSSDSGGSGSSGGFWSGFFGGGGDGGGWGGGSDGGSSGGGGDGGGGGGS